MKFVILCALVAVASAHYLPSYHDGGHFSGKAAFKGDIYFDGCYEPTCHKDGFDGYGCKAGRCSYICHPKGCYETHAYSQASGESWGEQEGYGKRFEKGGSKGQSQYKGHVQFSGRVDFAGCSSEHCHSGEYEGYNCKDGHCATVLYKVGLCISLWDIVSIGDKFISHDTGAYNIAVTFRMICFRPTVDEIITGSVKNCTRDGLQVSLYFFDDIFIPADKLRHPSKFDYEQQSWIWQFRVEEEIWRDPNPDTAPDPGSSTNPFDSKAPYTILGSIVSDGLGLTCWWIN
nr:unnamed protein product [Spirometra erinaceieuropaei]